MAMRSSDARAAIHARAGRYSNDPALREHAIKRYDQGILPEGLREWWASSSPLSGLVNIYKTNTAGSGWRACG